MYVYASCGAKCLASDAPSQCWLFFANRNRQELGYIFILACVSFRSGSKRCIVYVRLIRTSVCKKKNLQHRSGTLCYECLICL